MDAAKLLGRKMTFDEHAGRYRFESQFDYLTRLCENRRERIEALNRGEKQNLARNIRKYNGEFHIFNMRHSTERDQVSDCLKDLLAYRIVLDENEEKHGTRNLTDRSGSSKDRSHVLAEIEQAKSKLTATYQRKQRALKLLQNRRPMKVVDRRLPTPEAMRCWRDQRHMDQIASNNKSKTYGFTDAHNTDDVIDPTNNEQKITKIPELQLPRIKAKLQNALDGAASDPGHGTASDPCHGAEEQHVELPSIFITQKNAIRSHEV